MNQRYSDDLVVTKDDFTHSGWREAIDSAKEYGEYYFKVALSKAVQLAMDNNEEKKGKVLWLLVDACSMMLKPQSNMEPFKPMWIMEGKRSAIPEDFSEQDILFFTQIVEEIDHAWLQARIADIAWLCSQPRDLKYARLAIDAYRQLEINKDRWIRGSRDGWKRAIGIATMLGNGAEDRLVEMIDVLMVAFDATTQDEGYLGLWLSELFDQKRFVNKQQMQKIAEHLKTLALAFRDAGELRRARDFFSGAAFWFNKVGDVASFSEMTVAVAEGWVQEAEFKETQENSYMVAASCYEQAIQLYRKIPRNERAKYQLDERMVKLRDRLSAASNRIPDEMSTISGSSIDISDHVARTQDNVRGKNLSQAMLVFVNQAKIDKKTIREAVIKNIQSQPLMGMLSETVISDDGRAIAKHDGVNWESQPSEGPGSALWAKMLQFYGKQVGFVVQSQILPALEILQLEHRLRETDFIELASRSPIVPNDRTTLFGKALYAGFDGDFVTAIHLLTPQIENMVRFHLKEAEVQTTNLDKDGIETEISLSALMDREKVSDVFDSNLVFELRALFCDSFGPNLRNEVAHGLISDDECQSSYLIYAWWFGLGLVLNNFWNAARPKSQDGDVNDGQ